MSNSKIVVITGVAGGIGGALAKEYHRLGHQIIGIDLSEDGLNKMEQEYTGSFTGMHGDVTDAAGMEFIYKRVEELFGVPDVWINNAGIVTLKAFLDDPLEKFQKVMDVNFTALVHSTYYWIKKMEEKGGTIVNIASMAGKVSMGGMSSYVASKHAVVGFTESIQQELEVMKSKVKLVLVTPGFVETNIIQVGAPEGFPENMKWMLTAPEDCARRIARAVERGHASVDPTTNGKFMGLMNRFSPFLTEKIGVQFTTNVLKK